MKNKVKSRKQLEAEYKKSLEDQPENFDNICRIIKLYLESDSKTEWEKALLLMKEFRDRFSHEPEIHKLASVLYMRMEDVEQAKELALEAAKKYVKLSPENPKAQVYLGYVYWWYGETYEAISSTKKGLELAEQIGDRSTIMYGKANLAYFYAEENMEELADTARAYAREAYEYDPTPAWMDTLGYVLMRFWRSEEDLKEAGELFGKALRQAGPHTRDVHEHVAELQTKR